MWDHPVDTRFKCLYQEKKAEKLVRQLYDASHQQQASTACALIDYCLSHEGGEVWQDACGRVGVPAALLQAAKMGDSQIQRNAFAILGRLVYHHEANQSAAGSSGAIADVLQLMKASDVGLQSEAVQTLDCLIKNHEVNQSAAESEMENSKVSTIQIANGEEDVREYAKVFCFFLLPLVSLIELLCISSSVSILMSIRISCGLQLKGFLHLCLMAGQNTSIKMETCKPRL